MFKYMYNGKEINKKDFESIATELYKWFDKDIVNAIDYPTVFDGSYKSTRTINDHVKSVLENNFSECSPQCFCDGSCKKPQKLDLINNKMKSMNWRDNLVTFKQQEHIETKQTAYKETEGKLFYELDWEFITQMAERMASNKKEGKYNLWNWKKPMTPKGVEDLKQASMRHLLAIMEGKYEDDGRPFGHLEALADNMMMLNFQIKNKNFSKEYLDNLK